MKYIEALRNGISDILESDGRALIMGEDIGEPYGGAFKVTKNIEKRFPEQVIPTPMSESALTGIAVGMALNGYKPILEIMFGDFITLCADQVINHASKFTYLFEKECNMVIRTPMGGYRGYGATHSQSLEKIFFGIPNIEIIAPNIFLDPGVLLQNSLNSNVLSIFIEHKLDYGKDIILEDTHSSFEIKRRENYSEIKISDDDTCDGYMFVYGGMLSMAMEIVHDIFIEEEVHIHLIVPTQIYPLKDSIFSNIKKGKDIFILEESNKEGGFTSEIARSLLEKGISFNSFSSYSAMNEVIGASKALELHVLPDKESILKEILERF